MYALPGEVVVRRRKSLVLPAALFVAGVVLLVLNHVYGAELSNNMRSALVFLGGSLALAGMITLAARFFSAEGAPYYRAGRCYLRYDELYFERGLAAEVRECVAQGDASGFSPCLTRRCPPWPWPFTGRPTTASRPCRRSSTPTWSTGR